MGDSALRIDVTEGLTPRVVDRVQHEARVLLEEAGVPQVLRYVACVVIEELCTNIIEHGHASWIELGLNEYEGLLNLFVSDNGAAFDPTHGVKARNIEEKLEKFAHRGMGLYMVRCLTDSFRYARIESGTNLVRIEMQVKDGDRERK